MNDFVLPEELDIYKYLCGRFEDSCNAGDAIEECLTAEITSAAWRLRRCKIVDGHVAEHSTLDPLLDTMLENKSAPSNGPDPTPPASFTAASTSSKNSRKNAAPHQDPNSSKKSSKNSTAS